LQGGVEAALMGGKVEAVEVAMGVYEHGNQSGESE
jgi:hypothetical protein